jgi:cell division protease FtsH
MIHDYAMGTGTGSLRVVGDGASEATRRIRDEEERELADQAFRAATAIINEHRQQLEQLAQTLLTNEVLEREDIEKVMAGVPKAAPERIGRGELGIAAASAEQTHEPRRPA